MTEILSRPLYRSLLGAVICVGLAFGVTAQIARRARVSAGPRAVALLEVFPSGKARLVPIAIMVDGKFFDANAYKAAPVPMTLESGTVYEIARNGTVRGFFTVSGARGLTNSWLGEGKFVKNDAVAAKKPEPPTLVEDDDQPPVLRHADSPTSKAPEPAKTDPPKVAEKPASPPLVLGSTPAPPADPDRPVLRRGKPAAVDHLDEKELTMTDLKLESFAAISDAGGPETHPFDYKMSTEEENKYRQSLLQMAAEKLSAHSAQHLLQPSGGKKSPKPPFPSFQDVLLHAFDLSSSNEPVFVLTASVGKTYVVVLARVDIYGELQQLLAASTDDHRLDVQPRLNLIDALDADGDGVGDLLFRQTSDTATGFIIYRASTGRLTVLFDGLHQ